MKILITGALGHIGSYIIRKLSIDFPNSKLILVDNLMTQRYSSLFDLPKNLNYKFIEADVLDINLSNILKDVNYLIHLSAITDATSSFEKSDKVENNNLNGTKRIALSCLENKVKLIHISSTSVYGTKKKLVDENCSLEDLNPQSPYASTKLLEEDFITNLSKNEGLNSISCRFGTIFGTSIGMRFHTAVNKFCWQAAMGLPITVWSTAYNQKRPYLDLNDSYNSIIHIIKNDIFDGEIYNVLTLNTTVKKIVDHIKEFVPELEIKFVNKEIMNQLSYEVSSKKFVSTGFKFKGKIREAISKTLNLLINKI